MEHSEMSEIDPVLLRKVPFGLLLADRDGRVSWLNDAMAQMLGAPDLELLGRSLGELGDPAQRLLSGESRLVQIGNSRRWVSRETHRAADGSCLYVALDVTAQEQLAEENARLHQQVEDLKLTDDLTGLPNKRAISQALDLHVSRSRRYQNPLSVVLVHIDLSALSGIQPLSSDPVVLAVSRFLRDRLRWVDQIARWEDNLFLLVLPETTEADARGLLDKIAGEQDSMLLPESYAEVRPKMAFGLACWKKGDDIRTLLRDALHDLRGDSGA